MLFRPNSGTVCSLRFSVSLFKGKFKLSYWFPFRKSLVSSPTYERSTVEQFSKILRINLPIIMKRLMLYRLCVSACLYCSRERLKNKHLVSAKILLILSQRWTQNQLNSSLRRYVRRKCRVLKSSKFQSFNPINFTSSHLISPEHSIKRKNKQTVQNY